MALRIVILFFIGIFSSSWAFAAAVVESVSGDVRLEAAGASSVLTLNQRIESGATITTGANGRTLLRFDDGQLTALNGNTTFSVGSYRFDAAKPEDGNVAMSLLKGALRMVTGLIGQRNRNGFALATPTATIGIRGTDFLVAVEQPTYFTVRQGAIAATNGAGSATFAAGETGMVATATSLPVSISAAALPASVSSAFSELGALPMAGGSPTGAQGATSAASGGIGAGAIAAGVIAVGAIAAAISPSSNALSTTTSTTTTTTTSSR